MIPDILQYYLRCSSGQVNPFQQVTHSLAVSELWVQLEQTKDMHCICLVTGIVSYRGECTADGIKFYFTSEPSNVASVCRAIMTNKR